MGQSHGKFTHFLKSFSELEPISAQLCGDGEYSILIGSYLFIILYCLIFQCVTDWIESMLSWIQSAIN